MGMTQEERRRHKDGMLIIKTLKDETSVVAKPMSPSKAKNIPSNVSKEIRRVISNTPQHEVYGSLAMESRTFSQRKPNDIDMVVSNPKAKAYEIQQAFKRKGYKTKVVSNEQFNSHVVQIFTNGEWVDAADIHPYSEHSQKFDVYGQSVKPQTINGINVQRTSDQLLRKANSVMAMNKKTGTYGAAPHRNQKDVSDFITTARILADSKQLQAEAELHKVKKVRKALKSWKRHAKRIKATGTHRDPIPETQEQDFIAFAANNPEINVEDIKFRNKKVLTGQRQSIQKKSQNMVDMSGFDNFVFDSQFTQKSKSVNLLDIKPKKGKGRSIFW